MFLIGISGFTLASLAGGLAVGPGMLTAAFSREQIPRAFEGARLGLGRAWPARQPPPRSASARLRSACSEGRGCSEGRARWFPGGSSPC
jgi:hypothetical protein